MARLMRTNREIQERRGASVARGIACNVPIALDRAENAMFWDVEGKEYIDFAGGIGALNTGHCNPRVVDAVKAQLDRYTHTCFQVMTYEPYVALAEKLNQIAPGAFSKKTALFTTGAEAIENAVKIARAYTGRAGIIAFTGAYHGRTLLTLGLTGRIKPYKTGFGPFPTEIFRVRFPDASSGRDGAGALTDIENIFRNDIAPERVAAIVLEPVQGEGGFNVAPSGFIRELRRLCDSYGILLIADEIQCGFGRTGKMFAIEHSGVVPDLVAMAKSLAGGFPLSAVVGRAEVMDAPEPGGLGGTYAGHPLACVAALAVLESFERDGVLKKTQQLGEQLRRDLEILARRFPFIGEIRGIGAMLAFDLCEPCAERRPAPGFARAVIAEAARRGLLLLSCGPSGNTIRILVPLTAETAHVDRGVSILSESLTIASRADPP